MNKDAPSFWNNKNLNVAQDIIDIRAVQHLHELDEDGSFGIIPQLLQMYGDALPTRIRALEDSAERLDLKQVSRDAHAFKSPSAHLGMRRVVSLLQEIEDGEYEIEELNSLIQQVAMEAHRAQNILAKNYSFKN